MVTSGVINIKFPNLVNSNKRNVEALHDFVIFWHTIGPDGWVILFSKELLMRWSIQTKSGARLTDIP